MALKFIIALLLSLSSGCASQFKLRSCSATSSTLGPTDFQVSITRYGDDADSEKSIIILPPTGGTNYIDRSYADRFCRAGYDVYILNDWTTHYENRIDFDIHQEFYGEAQRAITMLTDHIKSRFVGLIGTSVGALHASVAASMNKRLNAILIIVGGAPIAEVIVNSDLQSMKNLNLQRKQKFGFKTNKEIENKIETVFKLEPMALGELYKTKSIGMSIALEDTTVPTENQLKLKNYLNPQLVITIPAGHFWAIVRTWLFHHQEILGFFDQSFKELNLK